MATKQPDADAVLADALGMVVARLKADWARELAVIQAEARLAVSEIRTAALEALLEQHEPGKAAKLRSIAGGGR